VSLDGAIVDQRAYHLLCFLVHTAAVESTIDKGGGLPTLKRQKLPWIALDFLLSDFKDGFGDLCFIVLNTHQ
jgi:hypothetical protein